MRPDPRRVSSLLLGIALSATALAAPVAAQDESSAPEESVAPASCAILTADEVSAAFQEELTLEDGDGLACQFDADYGAGRFMSLFTSVADDTSAQDVVAFLCPTASPAPEASAEPCGVEVPIGDTTGTYIPEGFGTMLYVDLGTGDLLAVQLVGDPVDGVDKLAALTQLSELALPRVASVPQPIQTQGPAEATFVPDAELEALFPTEIAGQTLEIQSYQGAEAFSDVPQAVLDALAGQGKSLADLSVAQAYSFDANTSDLLNITAFQVDGADMAAMTDAFVSALNDGEAPAEQTTRQISGKDVIVVRPTSDSTDDELQYVYPSGDVLWMVAAAEPALSEVFSKLP